MTNVIDNVEVFGGQNAETEEEFGNPINITDILAICKEYSRLGYQIQTQIEYITELGIEEALNKKLISISALPLIKNFLKTVSDNPLFGDAADEAYSCLYLIENFELKNPNLFKRHTN